MTANTPEQQAQTAQGAQEGGSLLDELIESTRLRPDDEAYAMLSSMSGGWHEVHTAIALASTHGMQVALSTTRVKMMALSHEVIMAYVASGEPRDKAGAYGIQGLGGTLIERIEGSYSGVMGLPLYETASLLRNCGFTIPG